MNAYTPKFGIAAVLIPPGGQTGPGKAVQGPRNDFEPHTQTEKTAMTLKKALNLVSTLLFAVIVTASLVGLTGCASMQYGDGKAGNIPLDPAVQKLATALDAKIPGSGNMLRKYFATASRQRVPPGWEMVLEVRHRTTGEKIDLADYELVPDMRRAAGGATSEAELLNLLNSAEQTNAASGDLLQLIQGAGGAK